MHLLEPQFLVPELASGGQTLGIHNSCSSLAGFSFECSFPTGLDLLFTAAIAQREVCAVTACATLLTGRLTAVLSAASCSCRSSPSRAGLPEQHRALSWAGHGPVPRTSLQLPPAPRHLHSPAPQRGLQATPRLESEQGSHWPNYNVKPQFPHI